MNATVLRNKERFVGEVFKNNEGLLCEVIDYVSCKEVFVKFLCTASIVKTDMASLKRGNIKDKAAPKVFNTGFIGFGQYNRKYHEDSYSVWADMLRRCYKDNREFSSYKDTYVCDEWHSFQNFAMWYYGQQNFNKFDHNGVKFSLDKDLLGCGELYSPETCCLIPLELNNMVKYLDGSKKPAIRNKGNLWIPRCYFQGKEVWLGSFPDEKSATFAWNVFTKEKIMTVLSKYKDDIISTTYDIFLELLEEKF